MDILEAVKAKALKSVLKPDGEYHARFVRRWYSRTFHTPLHIVEELPTLDLFEHFYECEFEQMDPDRRQEVLADLLLTEEQRTAKKLEQDADDAAASELLKVAERENEKLAEESAKIPEPLPPIPVMREPELPAPKSGIQANVPPDIKMTFIEQESFEEEIEGWGALAPPPKGR